MAIERTPEQVAGFHAEMAAIRASRTATAKTAYAHTRERVDSQLVLLASLLTAHARRFAEDDANYGFVGDLAAVESKLGEVLAFLCAESEETEHGTSATA